MFVITKSKILEHSIILVCSNGFRYARNKIFDQLESQVVVNFVVWIDASYRNGRYESITVRVLGWNGIDVEVFMRLLSSWTIQVVNIQRDEQFVMYHNIEC